MIGSRIKPRRKLRTSQRIILPRSEESHLLHLPTDSYLPIQVTEEQEDIDSYSQVRLVVAAPKDSQAAGALGQVNNELRLAQAMVSGELALNFDNLFHLCISK